MMSFWTLCCSQGDSGGPLLAYEGNDPTVVGLTSFAVRCGDWKFPGVFTRVSSFINWIRSDTPAVFTTNSCKNSGSQKDCRKGEFLKGKKCKSCATNAVSEGGKVKKCTKCKGGLVRDSAKGNKCSCRGSFAVGRGLQGSKCVKCKRGTFAGENDKECRKCPKGTKSKAGAESCK